MKSLIIFTFLFSILYSTAQEWQQIDNFPGNGRDDGTVFTIGNKVYCGLGMNPWFGFNGDFYTFDLNTESWMNATAMPSGEERQYANGFSHNGAGYVFGGVNGNDYFNDLWKFDPANNIWSEQTTLPAVGRSGSVCFVIADTAYFIGGKSVTVSALKEVWAYNLINGTWSQKADFPLDGMWRGIAFSWNGTGIVGLGKDNGNNLHETFYKYLPQSDTWELASGLAHEGTTYTSAAQIGNRAYLYGGMNSSGVYLNTFERLNLETFEWSVLAEFPSDARRGGMAFTGENQFYITTGVSATERLNETWKASSILALPEKKGNDLVKIFPNPVQNSLTISSPETIQEITISDLSGKTILQKSYHSNLVQIENEFPSGIYLLHVKGENFVSVTRIVSQ